MSIRGVLRGTVDDALLSAVADEVSRRYGPPAGDGGATSPALRRVPAENWLSEPAVVADRWFVKVVADRHVRVHALLNAARNLGARAVGAAPFFEDVGSPAELVTRQHAAVRRFRQIGVRTPRPVGTFEHEGLGVLVLAYLAGVRALDDCDPAVVRRVAPDLFASLASLHDAGIAHGDVRAENLLVADGALQLIDPTTLVRGAGVAADYDVACALATLAPLVGPEETVRAARTALGPGPLAAAVPLLEFVELRPDHAFDRPALRAAVERAATRGTAGDSAPSDGAGASADPPATVPRDDHGHAHRSP